MVSRTEGGNRLLLRRIRSNHNAWNMLLMEPLFGIVYNLFNPFLYVYMSQLGCSEVQIGLLTTVGLLCQFVFSIVAAPITDRLGRRWTTLIFDLLSWSLAVLLWMVAHNFWVFLVAAVLQAINRIVVVSWTCLMVEDTEKDLLVTLFSWITVAGLLSGFFSPAAAVFVQANLIVAMRWLLGAAFVVFTGMFILRHILTKETSVGRVRMAQSRQESLPGQLRELSRTAVEIWRAPKLRFLFLLTAVYNMALTVRGSFISLLLTETLGFGAASIGFYSLATSAVMLAVYFLVIPHIQARPPKRPLTWGLALCAAGFLLLAPVWPGRVLEVVSLVLSVVLTSVGTAVAQPFIDGLGHASIDNDKRANMTAILSSLILLATAPFGWLGGLLFKLDGRLPFVASAVFYVLAAVLMAWRYHHSVGESTTTAVETTD